MIGLNEVILVGTVAAEPRISNFDGDKVKADLFVVVNEREPRKDEQGNTTYQEVGRFSSIEFWGGNAKFIRDYVKKGEHVAISGKTNRSSWEEEGQKKSRQYVEGKSITKLSTGVKKLDTAKSALNWLQDAQTRGQSLQQAMEELKSIISGYETVNTMA